MSLADNLPQYRAFKFSSILIPLSLIASFIAFKEIGKTPGKDKKQGKRTLLSIIGKKNTINFCEEKIYNFIKNNKNEFNKYPILKELLNFNIKRLK